MYVNYVYVSMYIYIYTMYVYYIYIYEPTNEQNQVFGGCYFLKGIGTHQELGIPLKKKGKLRGSSQDPLKTVGDISSQ